MTPQLDDLLKLVGQGSGWVACVALLAGILYARLKGYWFDAGYVAEIKASRDKALSDTKGVEKERDTYREMAMTSITASTVVANTVVRLAAQNPPQVPPP